MSRFSAISSSAFTKKLALALTPLLFTISAQAQILPEAAVGVKIPLTQKPTSRPMMVAFVPMYQRYYIADGGLAPAPGDLDMIVSKSKVHIFDVNGNYVNSAKPGYDNRSIYFNPNSKQLEVITYNISSAAGFAPNTGVFSLDLSETGDLKETSKDIYAYNPAFGDAATMPAYNYDAKVYYAKQERSNTVLVVDLKNRESVGQIALDLKAANVQSDDITEHYVAYTGVAGEELAVLDVDHKSVLIFDLTGKFIGKSALPSTMKLRSQNHLNGLGYANGMMFVYHEPEGEFGTYYGFKVLDQVK
jgi:hypothetical protein